MPLWVLLPVLLVATTAPIAGQTRPGRTSAVAILDESIAAMGGDSALRAIRGARLDVMTQWQRTWFGDHPYADQPSYERNTELRDYAGRQWRNTRSFLGGPPGPTLTVVVADTVAAVHQTAPGGATRSTPLNIAYVDERRELFAFAPERVALLARAAADLDVRPDTTIDGVRHARVTATIDGFPATLFIRRTDRLPAMVRFVADETNDFGLAPWGAQQIEFWYSAWQPTPLGVLLPRQRDVRRVGRPYKRMTVLAAELNPPTAADSFAIPDSLVRAYFASQARPMWDRRLDSARIIDGRFARVPPQVGSAGAVKVGGVWVLLETGQAVGAAGQLAEWLERTDGAKIGAGFATFPRTGNGGLPWLADRRIPIVVAPGAAPFARHVLGARWSTAAPLVVLGSRWVRVGSDSLLVEPVDAPDVGGAIAVYSPTHRWLYAALAGAPTFRREQDRLLADLRARGLPVERIGSLRTIDAPLPGDR